MDMDILVVVTASVFIMPAPLFMEQLAKAAGRRSPVIPLSGDGEVPVHKIRLDPTPCPVLIAWANFCWNWKWTHHPGNQNNFWERSTNRNTLNETFFIHKGQHSGSPCAISPHQTFYWFYLSQAWRVFLIIKIQVKAIWTRGRCGRVKLLSARQPHQNAYIIDTCKWFLRNPQSSLKNNDDPLSFCSITLSMLFSSHGYMS